MTERSETAVRARKAHRAAGSRKAAVALSAAATAGLMIAMATARPAWTSETAVATAPEIPDPVVAAPGARSQILLPVPPERDGSLVAPTIAPATPQPVQLDPVAAPTQVITRTVVVQRSGASATTKSNGSR